MKNKFLILEDTIVQNIQLAALNVPIFAPEDQLYLEAKEVNNRRAEKRIEDTNNFFRINGAPIGLPVAELEFTAILNFQAVATAIPVGPNPCTNWLTGLRVFFAIKSNKLTLYYRPVKFCLLRRSYGQGIQLYGHYQLFETNSYYKYEANVFSEVTDPAELAIVLSEIDAYQDPVNGIKIIRRRSETQHTDFDSTYTIQGDVQSLIFSFQEFAAINEANPTVKIKVWNSAEEDPYQCDKWIKHGLLLSSDKVTYAGGNLIYPPYLGTFSDLSHLCPPSCGGDFTFRIRA